MTERYDKGAIEDDEVQACLWKSGTERGAFHGEPPAATVVKYIPAGKPARCAALTMGAMLFLEPARSILQ